MRIRISYNRAIMSSENNINKIWQKYWSDRGSDSRNQLMGVYLPLVPKVAELVLPRIKGGWSIDEIQSTAIFALLDAIQKFTSNHIEPFEKFAKKFIRRGIIQKARSSPPAWRALPNTHRLIVMLRYFEKVRFTDIASLLNIPCEEVKAKYNAALAQITHILPHI